MFFLVPPDKSATQRFVATLASPECRGIFGPTDRAWTGEAGNGKAVASRKSFREPGGTELPVVVVPAGRQASDSRPVFWLQSPIEIGATIQ
jgi:hypothetical protein